jgi:hypothetical protein
MCLSIKLNTLLTFRKFVMNITPVMMVRKVFQHMLYFAIVYKL